MSENLNTDKSFREKLENFSSQPPPYIWENIQGQLAAQKRKKRLAYIGWISAAAVVVFAFLAGWFFNNQSGEIMPTTTEQQQVQQKIKTGEPVEQLQQADSEIEDVFKGDVITSGHINKGGLEDEKDLVAASSAEKQKEKETDKSFMVSVERFSLELLEGVEAIFTMDYQDKYLAEQKTQQTEVKLTKPETLLIAENVKNIDKTAKMERGWILGMHVAPGYSSHSANHTEQYASNMTYSSESGNGNVGGGFSVQYKTGKRLRIESGLYYAQSGQKSGNSPELFSFGKYNDLAYAAPERMDSDQPSFSNTVQVNNAGIAMNSVAGVINMQGTPKGAEITAIAENSLVGSSNTLRTSGEFSQVFEFVEIPFYLRYSVVDKKIGVELMGGFNAGVLVGNSAYIDNEYGNQKIGSTEDISTLNLSGTVGVGVNYALGKHISVAVEPRLNYYLNSINTNPEIDYRPYRIGFFTGLYYEF